MKRSYIVGILIAVALSAMAAWYFWSSSSKNSMEESMPSSGAEVGTDNGVMQDDTGKQVKYWYDPMVPTQKFDKPGKSPFMDMQLVPKYAGDGGDDSSVSIPSQTLQNLGIRLEKVASTTFSNEVSAVGRIEPDERRITTVQTRVAGFVERLLVRAEGDPVKKGQKVAEMYSPELLAAQQEYLALLELDQIDSTGLQQAARKRLRLLGMSDFEINGIKRNNLSTQRFGIYAPTSGVVTELGVREGGELMSGNSLMKITDLSRVWLIAEVPERDAGMIEPGLEAKVELQSRPGETVTGKVSYLYPTLDEATRTLRVRVELANPKGNFRPGMYANVLLSQTSQQGLAVPTESIIATGQRKVIIVKNDKGFQPAEVVTGLESDGKTQILEGLSEGETVVASGQFLIDSEASLSGVLARLSQQGKGPADMDSMASGEGMENMDDMKMDMTKSQPEKMPKGTGRVVDVNLKEGSVTLAHEPIPELGWPSMTMGFKVKDAKQLQSLKVGDAVKFILKTEPGGEQYILDGIKKDAMSGSGELR